jgi:pimeloyl-ACP methyl ester carboxylesterase
MTNESGKIAGFSSEYANVNGAGRPLLDRRRPKGRPVLLWHGFLGTSYSWHKVTPLLADTGYSILVPDVP